jgi:uncharacterized membrane protein YqgA involved in biofilm formation
VTGTLIGVALHKGIKEKYKNVLYDALGLACFAIGLNAVVTNLPKSQYPVLFIAAMAVGSIVGVALDIDGRFHRLVDRKSQKGSEGNSSSRLADGLATATLVYCIGPLSMLGPVISALEGDNTFLFTNATLDLVTATIFGSTYGIGMLLAAPVLFLWQGMFYGIAMLSSTAVSEALMAELLIVGGLLITGSGLSLLRIKDCHVLNMLPALLVPPIWFLIMSLIG